MDTAHPQEALREPQQQPLRPAQAADPPKPHMRRADKPTGTTRPGGKRIGIATLALLLVAGAGILVFARTFAENPKTSFEDGPDAPVIEGSKTEGAGEMIIGLNGDEDDPTQSPAELNGNFLASTELELQLAHLSESGRLAHTDSPSASPAAAFPSARRTPPQSGTDPAYATTPQSQSAIKLLPTISHPYRKTKRKES